MKQENKSLKQMDLSENINKRNLISGKTNKMKSNNTRNESSNIINLVGKSTSVLPNNYDTNTYKNIKAKERLMKIFFQKGKKRKIKDKNGKILILDKIKNNSNKENISLTSNINYRKNSKELFQEDNLINNTFSIRNYIRDNKKSNKYTKSRTHIFQADCVSERLKTLDNKNLNKIDNELAQNEESYFHINGNRHKGTISFNNFIINKSNEFDNIYENNEFYAFNKFKERKSSYGTKNKLCLDNEENIDLPNKKIFKIKNNSVLLNFRNSQRKKSFNNNNNIFSASLDGDSSNNKNSLKFSEILRNNKNKRIILKQDDSSKNIEKEKINIINKTENVKENKEKQNEEIIEDNNKEKENNKSNRKKTDIYDEIIDEVKQEKNYIQKIVHMKLKEGIQLLKQNSHRHFNIRYNSKTYKDETINREKSIKAIKKQFKILNFLNNEKSEINENNTDDYNSTFFSNKTEKNLNYIKINNSCKNFDENRCVKIKKIKLDKLKIKLRKGSFNIHQRNNKDKNINISLSLNNKIININNNQKIYAPKKPSNSKKKSIELSSIPFCCPKSYKTRLQNSILSPVNSISPILYKRPSEENYNNSYQNIFFNSIKPFNESLMNDLNKIETNNKIVINTDNDINKTFSLNNKTNVQYTLYNKVRIKKDSNKKNNKNLNNSRIKTFRYIKKNKSKLKRLEDSLEKDKEKENTSKNKIMKTQEIQFGILKKNNSRKSIKSNLDRTEPINFNLNDPLNRNNKQNSFINTKTFLSHDMNDIIDIPNFDISRRNMSNISQLYSNNDEEISMNNGTCKLSYNLNYDYDKISNHNSDVISNENMKLNYLKEELKDEQHIYYLLNFEDLLIIEDKLNLILIVLEKGNKNYEEYFDFIIYFFSSNLKNKLEQIFKYFQKETELMKIFVNFSLVFILICYDFVQNKISINIDNHFNLMEIFQLIYTNILLVINSIKNKIEQENKDNYTIRLIELSKIGYLIKDKLSKIDNDNNLIKEVLINNTHIIIQKITNIINNIKLSDKKYNEDIFQDIKTVTFMKIYNFFLEKILKEDFIGCSVLAYSYLKQKKNFVPSRQPYLRGKNKKNYSLVLDLDETLIHFKLKENEEGEGILKLRPGVFTFLEKISEFYEIILFTEASEAYIKLMMEAFNDKKNKKYFDFVLYRQYTIIEGNDFVKDLNRLGRPLNKTIIIDNVQKNFCRQKNNGILIKPFLGEDKNDTALIDLIPILINIAKDDIDVRNGLMKYRDEILTKITSNLFRRGKKIKVD